MRENAVCELSGDGDGVVFALHVADDYLVRPAKHGRKTLPDVMRLVAGVDDDGDTERKGLVSVGDEGAEGFTGLLSLENDAETLFVLTDRKELLNLEGGEYLPPLLQSEEAFPACGAFREEIGGRDAKGDLFVERDLPGEKRVYLGNGVTMEAVFVNEEVVLSNAL